MNKMNEIELNINIFNSNKPTFNDYNQYSNIQKYDSPFVPQKSTSKQPLTLPYFHEIE